MGFSVNDMGGQFARDYRRNTRHHFRTHSVWTNTIFYRSDRGQNDRLSANVSRSESALMYEVIGLRPAPGYFWLIFVVELRD